MKWILELSTLSKRVKCFSVRVAKEQKTCGVFRVFFNGTREFKATQLFCLTLLSSFGFQTTHLASASTPYTQTRKAPDSDSQFKTVFFSLNSPKLEL